MTSHTSTGEWKSFEVRMRRRKAERLALRADIALDAGCLDEARALILEARRVSPNLPALKALQHRLDAPPAPAAAPRARAADVGGMSRAACVALLLAAGAAIALGTHSLVPAGRLGGGRAVPESARAAAPGIAAQATPGRTPGESAAAAVDSRNAEARARTSTDPRTSGAWNSSEADVPRRPERSTPVSLPRPIALTPANVPGTAAPAVGPVSEAVTAIAAAVESLPAPSLPDDGVRGALDRYASAYNQLNADAAPRVQLGDCRVDMTGGTARATCLGSATWTARIGDGTPRVEARRWTFDLARAGAGWRVVEAHVQNR